MRQRIQFAVLVLIGLIVFSMIVSGVLKMREASLRMQCRERLRNIAIANHNYHQDHHKLPPGYIGPWPDRPGLDRAPNVGLISYLIPYLLKDSKTWEVPYFQTDLKAPTDPAEEAHRLVPAADAPWWTLTNPATNRSNQALARLHIPELLCPSMKELQPAEGMIVALHSYGSSYEARVTKEGFLQRHVITTTEEPEVTSWGTTHYLGVAGRFGLQDKFVGVFGNRTALTLGQITVQDGTSNTLGIGEACGGVNESGRKTAYSWFCGSLPTYYGLYQPPKMTWQGFNGPHREAVHFAFMDASVRSIKRRGIWNDKTTEDPGETSDPNSQSWLFFQEVAGRKDGYNHDVISMPE